jgi:hypothetical protein
MPGWVARDEEGNAYFLRHLYGGAVDASHKGAKGVRHEGRMLWYYPVKWSAPPSGLPHVCNFGCRHATHPECRCQCHGKNHGKDNDGQFFEADVVEI